MTCWSTGFSLSAQPKDWTPTAPTTDVTVGLLSGDTTEVTVPATVTLRAGQTSATFDVTIVDDTAIDQTRTATIIARVENWTDGSASIDVIDNDNDLMLSVPAMAWEGDGVLTDAAVVSICGTLPTDVVASLVSGDTSELTVPATVTIPAGSTSATFDLTAIDDADYDGARPVMVWATAAGFNDGSKTIDVADDDVHHFTLDTIDTPQTASEPFGATIRAKDVDDRTISVYAGTVGLHGAGDGGAVTVEPATAGTFADGTWTGDVTVHAVDCNVVIAADDGWGHTGASNPLDVVPGPLDHFFWSSIVSPQYVNIPFAATLTATDAHGYTTTGFQGTVDLSGLAELGTISIAITPTGTAFLDGAWTGDITILEEADDVILRADDGAGHVGQSNALDVETAPPLLVDVPADAAEGDAMVQGTLSILSALGDDLLVYLSSDDPSEATVPDTATILAGQTAATFEISILDDAELDGFQEVRITATAAGHARGSDVMTVADNETATLTVDLPDGASEGDGVLSGAGTVTCWSAGFSLSAQPKGWTPTAPTSNVVVELNSEDTTEVIVPATVTIPAGRTSVTFNVRIVDDVEIDGTGSATITARVANWTDGSKTMDVFDNEHLDLIVTLPAGAWESDGVLTGAAAVSISGTLPTDLVVSLGSDDSELNVPATATIPAGDTSVHFDLTVVDDSDSDGVQTATVSATAAGFNDGSGTMDITDDDVHHFAFDTIDTPQRASEPFFVTIRATNVDGQAIPTSVDPVDLGGDGDGGPAEVNPAISGPLVDGIWTGMVTVVAPDTNVVLTADDGRGHAGTSNPFDVVPGPMDHLRFSTIATPQYVQLPLSATLTALDAHDYVATGFDGTVQLSGSVTAETTSTVVITECDLGSPDFIEIQNVSGHEVDTAGWVLAVSDSYSRIDDVNGTYWFLPSSMAAGEILYRSDDQEDNYWGQNILFNVGNAGWAIIIDDAGQIVDAVAWDWATFRLNAMDALINGHHVTIGDEFSGGGISSSGAGTVQRSGDRDHNAVSDFAWTSPPSKGVQNSTLTVPFTGGTLPVAVTPNLTAAFTDGVWTGEISVLEEALSMCLHADGGNGQVVDSNLFDVEIAPPLAVDVPAQATEGRGVLQGVVSIPFALAVDLVVDLFCDDPSEATVPEGATILAGSTEAAFEITIVDDSELDWYQHPTLSASAAGYLGGSDTITVADNEQAIVTVKLPRDAAEGDVLLGQGQVIASRAPTSDVVVDLTSEDTTELIVPATVTIPAGQLTAMFDITVVDDTQIDATQNASIVARVDNWIYGTDSMDILDNESLDLVVTLPPGVWEGDGVLAGTATVHISGTLPADLVVSLASDDTGILQVPPTATIPAGDTSATFDLTMVDDADCDGAQMASVTAAAAGFNDGSQSTDVADDDVHHFTFDAIGTPQTAGEPFPVTILARNVDHQTIPAYAPAVSLSGAGQSGAVAVSPATTGTFAAGRWTGSVTVHAVDDQVVLTADDGLGHAGTSNALSVVPGPLDHFGFSTITSPRPAGVPLRLTITAQDAHGYTTSDFQGSVELGGWVGTGKAPG